MRKAAISNGWPTPCFRQRNQSALSLLIPPLFFFLLMRHCPLTSLSLPASRTSLVAPIVATTTSTTTTLWMWCLDGTGREGWRREQRCQARCSLITVTASLNGAQSKALEHKIKEISRRSAPTFGRSLLFWFLVFGFHSGTLPGFPSHDKTNNGLTKREPITGT